MKRWLKITLIVLAIILLILFIGINFVSRGNAIDFVHVTKEERAQRVIDESDLVQSPEKFDLPCEDLVVKNASGMNLVGWYIPSQNGAAVILLHGYEEPRYLMLQEADMLYRHGYGVLVATVRAHDDSDGELVYFGCGDREMEDLEAWYQYLLTRTDVDPDRIGILGQSTGGSQAIQYARQNKNIRALMTHSAFSSIPDTVVTAVEWKTGMPGKLFAPFILFWAKQELGCDLHTVSAKTWIRDISPRPVFILHGGKEVELPINAGELLFEAAGEPKEYWFCEDCTHHNFDTEVPEEFEQRMIAFFNTYLLDQ